MSRTVGPSIPDRLSRKIGRFSVDFETNQINAGLRGHQHAFGDEVDYYRFLRETSVVDDIYDEGGLSGGKTYLGPIQIPAIRVVHLEGSVEQNDTGFYFNDSVHVTLMMDGLTKIGMTAMDVDHQAYLKDRMVYDNKVFRVTGIQVLGQIQRRDIIVSIDGTQVKPDELVDDPQWKRWSD